MEESVGSSADPSSAVAAINLTLSAQHISNSGGDSAELEEEFTCGVCYELLVMPTTLNCGHSFCRHCLALWFDTGKKAECPSCRSNFEGLPMENIQIRSSLLKLFGDKYTHRRQDVLDDKNNKKAIEDFEKIVTKRHKDDTLSATSCGCLMGVTLALVFIFCLYLAVHWRASEFDLLVRKPLVKWSNGDVSYWLEDIGLQLYEERVVEQNVNGWMLSEIEQDDLEPMLAMSNPLHQRMFLQALNYTKINGVKQPTNLWEYKALYNGYTSFLFYSMEQTPRLALLYLYNYDRETYSFYKQSVVRCNSSDVVDPDESWWFFAGAMISPHFIQAKFAYCFTSLHYWTSRFIIIQAVCKGLIDLINIGVYFSKPSLKDLFSTALESTIIMVVFYGVGYIWWLIPTILTDALFYAAIYFSPAYYAKELVSRLIGY